MVELGLLIVVIAEAVVLFLQLASRQKEKNLMRQAMEKADRDGTEMVRIPYNQVMEVFGLEARHGPRPDKDRRNIRRHPALMSPARRAKL